MKTTRSTMLKGLLGATGLLAAAVMPAAAQKGLEEPFQEAFKQSLAGKTVAVSWAYSPSYAKPLSVPQGLITLLTSLAATVPEFRAKLHDGILANAEKWAAARPNDPQIQAAIEQLKTPEGFMAALIVGGIMLFVLSIVLGALGGFVGATVSRRRR